MTESDCKNHYKGICISLSDILEKQIFCKSVFDCDFKKRLYSSNDNVIKMTRQNAR